MSASVFRLAELPVEILEQVLLHLPIQDVIKGELVRSVIAIPCDAALTFRSIAQISRRFQELIHDSPTLQFKRELFSAGLIENPRNPCDFTQRRKLYEEYRRKWSNTGRVVKTTHQLPEELPLERYFTTTPGWNLIGYHDLENGNISFVRVPPPTSQRPIERWGLPPRPFKVKKFAVHPPDNLLAVVEERER